KLGETFEVHMSLLDSDSKRLHVFFELYGEDNKRAAVSEQMLMGMDQSTGRPAPFPNDVQAKVQEIADNHTPVEKPKEAGREIGRASCRERVERRERDGPERGAAVRVRSNAAE